MKKVHYYAGVFLSLFIALHLTNHLFALVSPAKHIAIMELIRPIYRNILVEPLILIACLIQIIAGLSLVKNKWKNRIDKFDRLHIYSGIYLAFFLLIHPTAIMAGRYYFHVDTNFWFGAMVVNISPLPLFYGPYYFLGICAFFAHIACIHRKRVKELGWQVQEDKHAKIIIGVGILVALLILAGFTDFFQGLTIPDEYQNLLY